MSHGLPSSGAKRAYNFREKAAYHLFRETHGPVSGGQRGFRGLMRGRPIAQRPLSLLGLSQRSKRETALRVLRRSRRFNEPLSKAAREAHTTPETVRRYLGRSGYRKVGGRWRPTNGDSLIRVMSSFEDGRRVRVVIRGSKTATLLGRYNRDVRTYLEDPARDPSILRKWEGRTFKDARGQIHTFETDPAAIRSIYDRSETETGAVEIYPEGDESEAALVES